MMLFSNKDLRKLIIPLIIEQILAIGVGMVDTMMISHEGDAAISGVSLVDMVNHLLITILSALATGGAVIVSQYIGHRDRASANRAAGQLITVTSIISVGIAAVCLILCKPLLSLLFGAIEADVMASAVIYFRISALSYPFLAVYNACAALFRSMGNSKISMVVSAGMNITNALGNALLIFVFDMGVAGAAVATVISQAVSAVWILRFLMGKQTVLKLKLSNMKLIPSVILPCLGLGISTFVMVSTESILSMSFTSSLARYGGDVAVGAMTVLTSINQLITMPLSGIGQGAQPIISYNYGARKFDRVKEAFFCQFGVCVAYTTLFWLMIMLFPNVFAGIFTSDAALVDYTAWALRIFLVCGFSVGFQLSCQQAFMALGQAKISLFMALLRKVFLLIPLIFILPNFFRNKAFAVFFAEPVSDLTAAAVTTFMFFRFFLKMLREGKKQQ